MYKFGIFRMRTTRIDNGTHCAPCTRQLIYLFFRLFASTQPHNRISNNANKRQRKQHSKLKMKIKKRTECELKCVLSKNKHSPKTAKSRSTCNPICPRIHSLLHCQHCICHSQFMRVSNKIINLAAHRKSHC